MKQVATQDCEISRLEGTTVNGYDFGPTGAFAYVADRLIEREQAAKEEREKPLNKQIEELKTIRDSAQAAIDALEDVKEMLSRLNKPAITPRVLPVTWLNESLTAPSLVTAQNLTKETFARELGAAWSAANPKRKGPVPRRSLMWIWKLVRAKNIAVPDGFTYANCEELLNGGVFDNAGYMLIRHQELVPSKKGPSKIKFTGYTCAPRISREGGPTIL